MMIRFAPAVLLSLMLLPVMLHFRAVPAGVDFSRISDSSQTGIPQIRIPKTNPLNRLLRGTREPAVTTSLVDAVTEIPFLDDYNPESTVPMRYLPRTATGGFRLASPGVYELQSQSYCLHAGTYAPTKGYGYLRAPLAGPRAGVIRALAQNSVRHPEVHQHHVQTLIWAILARAKIRDMAPEMRQTASILLTAQQIAEVDGGALEILSEAALDRASRELATVMRPIFEAEARLRQLFSKPAAAYEELEQAAVRFGLPPLGEGSREIPEGRWSYHPAGYFVRYHPSGYSLTRIALAIPGPIAIERDGRGRIAKVTDARGARLELAYRDAADEVRQGDAGGMQGSAFSKVHFESLRPVGRRLRVREQKEWEGAGWAFSGAPTGQSRIPAVWSRFVNSDRAFDQARTSKSQLDALIRAVLGKTGPPRQAYLDSLDLAHLAFAVQQLDGAGPLRRFLQEAWQSAVVQACGGRLLPPPAWRGTLRPPALPAPGSTPGNPSGPSATEAPLALIDFIGAAAASQNLPEFDPSDGVACPGNTSMQRLLPSGRDQDDDECKAVADDIAANLRWLDAYSNDDLVRRASASDPYNTDLYDAMVGRYVAGLPTNNLSPNDVQQWKNAGMDVGTNSRTCEIGIVSFDSAGQAHLQVMSYQEIIDILTSQGTPSSVAACLVSHERTHQQQCFANNNFSHSTVAEFSNFERQAYCTQLRCLADYMEQKCKGAPPEALSKINQMCR